MESAFDEVQQLLLQGTRLIPRMQQTCWRRSVSCVSRDHDAAVDAFRKQLNYGRTTGCGIN
jgi:hypothetical protein